MPGSQQLCKSQRTEEGEQKVDSHPSLLTVPPLSCHLLDGRPRVNERERPTESIFIEEEFFRWQHCSILFLYLSDPE